MKIDLDTSLLKLEYDRIIVAPYKDVTWYDGSGAFRLYRTEEQDKADFYKVLGENDDKNVVIATFDKDDQDKAHQFAELLTECLTKIKSFEHENI